MRWQAKQALLIGLLVISSCASPPKLTPAGAAVKPVVAVPSGCIKAGTLIVQTNLEKVHPSKLVEQSVLRARNSAAWLFNATHVIATTAITSEGEQTFMVYQCPS